MENLSCPVSPALVPIATASVDWLLNPALQPIAMELDPCEFCPAPVPIAIALFL